MNPDEQTVGTRASDANQDEAMAQLYTRDRSLWDLLSVIFKKLTWHGVEVRFYMLLIIALGITNNKWLQPFIEQLAHENALFQAALAAGFHK